MYNKLNIFLLLLFLLTPLTALGQEEELLIPSLYPPSTGYYLDEVIFADTAGAGQTAWAEGRRVYVLERNGIYPSWHQINLFSGRKLKIRCEYGTTGSKPEIWMYDMPGSTRPPGNLVQAVGTDNEIILTNINISGYEEDTWGEVDGVQGGIVRSSATSGGVRIVIDSCILKSTNGNHVRTDAGPQAVIVTNSIFADMGNLVTSNLGAGKAVDLRANQVDTLKVYNNTFVNYQDRILRHYNSTSPIKNLWFNNNTIVNGLSFHGMLSLGDVDATGTGILEIKNNLLIDNFALGSDTCVVRQAEFDDSGENDPTNGLPRIVWIIVKPNTGANWDIDDNYYTVSDSGAYMFNQFAFYKDEGPPLTWGVNACLAILERDTLTVFRKVGIRPVDSPLLMTEMIRWFYRPYEDGGAGKGKGSGALDPNYLAGYIAPGVWAYDYNRKTMKYYVDTFNCNFYSNATLSGIGDPRWSQIGPLTTGTSLSIGTGWNLVSVPRHQLDNNGFAIFPGMLSTAYAYSTITRSYISAPTLDNSNGYWVYYSSPTTVTNIGCATSAPLTITVANAGWVLIGSRAWPIKVSDIKVSAGAIQGGGVFTWDPITRTNTFTNVIYPGQGAWINVSAPCTLTLP